MDPFDVSSAELMLRLAVSILFGLLVGIERTRIGKRAGMRTYALVSLGAALFIVISGVVTREYSQLISYAFDPLRVASQLVVGIGFLGAGVIFIQKNELTGLTTAAGLWVAAGIGTACGYGLYGIALFTVAATLFVFEVLWFLEQKFIRVARLHDGISDSASTHQINEEQN